MNSNTPQDPRQPTGPGTPIGGIPTYAAPGAPPPPPAILSAPPNGPALLKALRRRWLLAAILGLLGASVVGGLLYFFLPPAKHVIRAAFHLNPSPRGTLGNTTAVAQTPESFRQEQAIKIKSKLVIDSALADPKIASLSILQESGDPLTFIERELRISPGLEILTISMQADNAVEARLLLDAICKAYLTEFVTNDSRLRTDRYTVLKRIKDLHEQDSQAREKLARDFNKRAGGTAETAALQLVSLQQAISDWNGQLRKIQGEIIAAEVAKKQLADRDPSKIPADDKIFQEYYQKDPAWQSMQQELEFLQQSLSDALGKAEGGEKSPLIKRKRTEIANLQTRIEERQKEIRPAAETYWRERVEHEFSARAKNIDTQLEFNKSLSESIKKQIGEAERASHDIRESRTNIEFFQKATKGQDAIYEAVCAELEKMKLDSNLPPRVRLIEDARIIQAEGQSRQLKLAAIGGGVTLLLILAAVALWEFRARRVDNVDQIIYGLGMPLIGTVPAMPKNRLPGLAGRLHDEEYEQWRFALQESVATTRTMLLNAARTTNLRMVMITSAMPGEGKTSLSTQLAVSMAMSGQRTLLLDFDMRNPSAYKLLGAQNKPGWAEVLRGEINVTDAVQPTAMSNLFFIGAGECDAVALKTLASDDLGQVLNWLRTQYDFVIVDTCPVLPVVDSLLVGRHMDGVIFSVLNDVSQLPKIYTATQRIMSVGLRMLGAVINGVREEKYGYGYRYGYGPKIRPQLPPAPTAAGEKK